MAIVEHEPEIVTTHGTFTQSEYKNLIIEKKKAEVDSTLWCPILARPCIPECALNSGDKCCIKTGEKVTRGNICPFTAGNLRQKPHCNFNCTMYDNEYCILAKAK